jgi:hypothetical protein
MMKNKSTLDDIRIVEGISGLWHYHITNDSDARAMCGAWTMSTSIPLSRWRVPFGAHFPKRPTWCQECEEKLKEHELRGNH